MAYTVALGVNPKAENLDAVLRFIMFLQGPEGQRELVVRLGHTLPSIKALAKDPELWPAHAKTLGYVEKYDRVQMFFYGTKTGELEGRFSEVLGAAVRGEISAQEALALLKEKIVEAFKG